MRMTTAENCRFIPLIWNVDNLYTDRINYQNPKSTNAVFAKIVFFMIKIWIYGENFLKDGKLQ